MKIMIADSKVLDHLIATGLLGDPVLCSNVNNILNRPRHLDKVPKPIGLTSVKNIEVCGCAKEFQVLYNSNYVAENAGLSHIDLNSIVKDCDYVVYVALKSLIMLGITKNEERALACREVFMRILQSQQNYIKAEDMFKALLDCNNYYSETISKAVIDSCFNEEEKHELYSRYQIVNDKVKK